MALRAADRLLLPLSYGFSVRYALPTGLIRRLSSACVPLVGLGWQDDELEALLSAAGAEVMVLPPAILSHEYRMFRRRIALLRDRRLKSPTTRIRRARQRAAIGSRSERLLGDARYWRDAAVLAMPGAARATERAEAAQIESGTNVAAFEDFLRERHIDAVLSLTPYHDQDALLLWAARGLGIPTAISVISFDNPTTRERLVVRGDQICVWNRFNADELLRAYPDLEPERITVTGAPQFDLHHRADLRLPRDEWCARLGLPGDRPIILYGAGPAQLVPGEASLVRQIDEAISDRRLPGEPFLLVRSHPTDPPESWRRLDDALRHGVVAHPWTTGPDGYRSWPTDDDLALQMSSLAHSDVHVNVCSSMTLDGAMFDRPQVGPRFVPGASRSEQRRVRGLYEQEHWAPIARSGGLATADDPDQLIARIAEGLTHSSARRGPRRRMLDDVLTFPDGGSTQRLVDQLTKGLDA